MQRFPCPFCGLRDEREFRFAAEAGKLRPRTAEDVGDAEWEAYLYATKSPRGRAAEVWVHLTCHEVFVMERDTVGMDVLGVRQLRKAGP
jgi:sarcosine oxidase subunit delta